MSGKKPSSPITGWFEAGLGLIVDQLTETNKQVQQKMNESQQTLDDFAARGAEVEGQLRKAIDPNQWLQLWQQSPLHHWVPSFTTPRQKRAMQLEVLSTKVDLLVEQVALLAAKQAAANAGKASEQAKPKSTSTRRTTKTTAKKAPAANASKGAATASKGTAAKGTTSTSKASTTRKRSTAKPKAEPKQD